MAVQHKSMKKKTQHLGLPTPKGILLAIGGKESKCKETRPEQSRA